MKRQYLVTDLSRPCACKDFLKNRYAYSSLALKRLRLYGRVLKNESPQRMIDPVTNGDTLELEDPEWSIWEKNRLPLPEGFLLQEDLSWMAIHKPAGLLTHPNYLGCEKAASNMVSKAPIHLVNRLDRDTSGIVLIAKDAYAHHRLASGQLEKTYLLICHGQIEKPITCLAKIARSPHSIIERIVDEKDGKACASHFFPIAHSRDGKSTLLACRIETGRTHQIRVHALHLGYPLVGESLYTSEDKKADPGARRQLLHAYHLRFSDPEVAVSVSLDHEVFAAIPLDFESYLNAYFTPDAKARLLHFTEQLKSQDEWYKQK